MERYYRVLGLSRASATETEIKRAYRSKALLVHPDRNPSGAEAFKALQDAYEAALGDVRSDGPRYTWASGTSAAGSGRGGGGTTATTTTTTTHSGSAFASASPFHTAAGAGYNFAKGASATKRSAPHTAEASAPFFSEAELFADAIPGGWRNAGTQQQQQRSPASNQHRSEKTSGEAAPSAATDSAAESRWRRAHGSRVPVSAYSGEYAVPPPPSQPAGRPPHGSPSPRSSAAAAKGTQPSSSGSGSSASTTSGGSGNGSAATEQRAAAGAPPTSHSAHPLYSSSPTAAAPCGDGESPEKARRGPSAPSTPPQPTTTTQAQWAAFMAQEHLWKPSSPLRSPSSFPLPHSAARLDTSEDGEEEAESAEEMAYRAAVFLHRSLHQMHHQQQMHHHRQQQQQQQQQQQRYSSHPSSFSPDAPQPRTDKARKAQTEGRVSEEGRPGAAQGSPPTTAPPPPPPPPSSSSFSPSYPKPSSSLPSLSHNSFQPPPLPSAPSHGSAFNTSVTSATAPSVLNGTTPTNASSTASSQARKSSTSLPPKEELYRQWHDVQASLHRKLDGVVPDPHPPNQTGAEKKRETTQAAPPKQDPPAQHPTNSRDEKQQQQQQTAQSGGRGRGSGSSTATPPHPFDFSSARPQDHRHQDLLLRERRQLQREYLRYRYTPDPADVGDMSDMEVYLLSELLHDIAGKVRGVLTARLTRGPCSTCGVQPRNERTDMFACGHRSLCVGCYESGVWSCPLCGAARLAKKDAPASSSSTAAPAAAAAAGEAAESEER